MKIISSATIEELLRSVESLDRKRNEYTADAVTKFNNFYMVELAEQDFWNLVFLQNEEVLRIAPRGEDRSLKPVVRRALALSLDAQKLSGNWDIGDILSRSREYIHEKSISVPPISLLEMAYQGHRNQIPPMYIQDGNHRCLGKGMVLSLCEIHYTPIQAYLATHTRLVT
jgi:hypothetical protein